MDENQQNSFMFYSNFLDAINQLPESERANACYQLCKYALNDELPDDKSMAMFCIGVKYSVHKYQGRGGKRERAGRKKNQVGNQDDFPLENGWGGKREGAGRPKNAENQEKKSSLENQNNQNNQNTQTETKTETETKTKKEITKEKKSTRFIKPTLEQVRTYCQERNNWVEPEKFINYYESKGWVVGKSPMKDWKAAVRTWEKSGYNQPKTEQPTQAGALPPPTLEEWLEFSNSLELDDDVMKKAYQYYQDADWYDRNGKKIFNWKQKIRAVWDKDENKIIKPRVFVID